MKRSEALKPLSHDHHQALFVAHHLRGDGALEELAEHFRSFWREHGAKHFRIEEEVLLPIWASLGTVDQDAAARVAREHLEIRTAALEVEGSSGDRDQLRRLGELLSAHVRYEERELFPLVEADLGEPEQRLLARAVVEAERR